MKAEELGLDRLLRFAPEQGKIFQGESRVLLLSANAMGALRKALVDAVGVELARGIFTRCGFACGYEDAHTLKRRGGLDDDREWLLAGPRMHAQAGHVLAEPTELRFDRAQGEFLCKARWRASYEAEQHERYLGRSAEPVCWSLAGYASGWATAVLGEKALCLEADCAGKGDPCCTLEIRRLGDWGERGRGAFFDLEGLDLRRDVSLLEAAVQDLSASRAAEAEAALRYRALLNFAADLIWIRALQDGRILEANQATVDRLGYPREELLGRPVFDFYLDERDRALGAKFSAEIRSRGSSTLTVSLRPKAGAPLLAELKGSLMQYGGVPAVLIVARDLSRDIQDQRRGLILAEGFRRSNDVMFYADRNGVILDVNEAFTRHYGYSREEAVGQTPRILRSRHTTDGTYRRMWAEILDPAKGYWRGEIINRAKDGREIPVVLTITAVRDASGNVVGYVSNATDISEAVALRERLAQSEALARLGEMAAVVAHEIRNPLGSIVMAAKQIAAGRLAKEDRAMVLRVLREESQRLNETLSNFLSYARPRDLRLAPSDLNALASELHQMLRSNSELIDKVAVSLALDPGLQPFPMDADQIRSVLWNIALNALQAMEGKGALAIETARRPGFALVRLRDTGPGIAQARLADIFKPFKTTKRQGTGLGLAIAERIVRAHGGAIEVESRPGQGAQFAVALPAQQG